MVQAARELGILGASLYDFSTSTAEDWREVRRVPVNPVESPSLPVAVGYARALGNITGSDRTHPKEVFYRTGGLTGSRILRFRVFGVQPEEVAILVNWRKLRDVVPTAAESWSRMRTTTIPGSFLHPSGTNSIAFVADGNYPDWSVWGVRQLTVT